jgi:hypothetical protein
MAEIVHQILPSETASAEFLPDKDFVQPPNLFLKRQQSKKDEGSRAYVNDRMNRTPQRNDQAEEQVVSFRTFKEISYVDCTESYQSDENETGSDDGEYSEDSEDNKDGEGRAEESPSPQSTIPWAGNHSPIKGSYLSPSATNFASGRLDAADWVLVCQPPLSPRPRIRNDRACHYTVHRLTIFQTD